MGLEAREPTDDVDGGSAHTPAPEAGEGPWVAEPLSGQTVVLHGAESLREVIAGLGAEVVTDTKEEPSALVYDARYLHRRRASGTV